MSGDMEFFTNEVKEVKADVKEVKTTLKEVLEKVTDFGMKLVALQIDYSGQSGENGLKGQVKNNTDSIKILKKKPMKNLLIFTPWIINIVLFVFLLWDRFK